MDQAATPWRSVEELENSPSFQALVVAAAGKPERSMGDSVIAAEPPQWKEVWRLSTELLSTPPGHAAALVKRLMAQAHLSGFPGLQAALLETFATLDTNWDSLYPPPDKDDLEDPYYSRVNLFRELSDDPTFGEALYRLPLVDVRGVGAYSARDIDIARGIVSASEEEQARCQEGLIRAAFDKTEVSELQALAEALSVSGKLCSDIEALFAAKAGSNNGLSMLALTSRVSDCNACFLDFAGGRLKSAPAVENTPLEGVESKDTEEVSADPLAASESTGPSVLANRGAASKTLQNIIAYYQQHEPSSPVPELAHRVLEMTTKSFFDVLQDLAPNHRENLPQMLAVLSHNPLACLIEDCHQRYLSGARVPSSSEAAPVGAGIPVLTAPTAIAVENRADVVSAIGELESFFRQIEPASPAPHILGEMRRLVPKTFVELLTALSRLVPETATSQNLSTSDDSV